MLIPDVRERAEALRRFNRFYTRRIGVLHEGLLESPFSLAEARVLYELAHRPDVTATELASGLGLDGGYLSRILRRFREGGLVAQRPSTSDRRRRLLRLTGAGREAFAGLDVRSQEEAGALLETLPAEAQRRLVGALQTAQRLLGPQPETGPDVLLRPHRPGDIGWTVERHAALYAEEYGWDAAFEALAAEIAAAFLRNYKPGKERCWIAEVDGERAGCVFVVRRSADVAQLRMLLVEPLGAGARPRHAARGRVPRLRPAGRLPADDAVDEQRPPRGPARLRKGRLRINGRGAAPQLRPRPRRADVGAGALGGSIDDCRTGTVSGTDALGAGRPSRSPSPIEEAAPHRMGGVGGLTLG